MKSFGKIVAAVGAVGLFLLWTTCVQAQESWPSIPVSDEDPHEIVRGPGGYFSWIKLILLVVPFLVWVRLADWVNRDSVQYHVFSQLKPEIWNPIVVFTYLGGLILVITIPWFFAGFPIYLLTTFGPWGVYQLRRRGNIPREEMSNEIFKEDIEEIPLPFQIKAGGKTAEESSSNLVKARQTVGIHTGLQLLSDSLRNRVDILVLDYSQAAVRLQQQVDGQFHILPEMDRETGDALLESLKLLAGLKPKERRREQRGSFHAKIEKRKIRFSLSSQGTQTGERVLIRIDRGESASFQMRELGLWPEAIEAFTKAMKESGYVIISAPPGHGLTTTWISSLSHADRLTGDWVAVADQDETETDLENIQLNRFDRRAKETPMKLLPELALKMPDAYIVPDPVDAPTMDWLTDKVVNEDKTAISRVRAKTAAEAILRLMQLSGNRKQFIESLSFVTCQRVIRRLCDECKQAVPASPQMVQQLGGKPGEVTELYQAYRLPPPEQRVDENGNPLEMLPCEKCGGVGYLGRIGVFETVVVDDQIRGTLLRAPKLDSVSKACYQQGNLTLTQQASRFVLSGLTSLEEIKRVFNKKS